MIFQDQTLPVIIGILILVFGFFWSFRLKRREQSGTIEPHSSETIAIIFQRGWLNEFIWPLFILGGGICILSWLSLLNIKSSANGFMLLLMFLGILFILLGVGSSLSVTFKERLDRRIRLLSDMLNITKVQIILLLGALLLALLASFSTVYSTTSLNQSVATFSWGIGVVSVIFGAWPRESLTAKPNWKTVIWATLLTGIAFLLRGTITSHVPVGLTGDEGDFGIWAYQFVLGNDNNLFSIGSHSFPKFYMFIQSIFIGLLGTTIQALRIPSAFIGALTVGGVYLFGKMMFNHRTGLLAGIFLAFFHFHIHFSRLGLNNVWDGMWYVLVLGGFGKGWQTQKRVPFLLTGVTMGLAQYFYISARVLPLILLMWLFLLAWFDRQRFHNNISAIVLLFFSFWIVVLPLFLFFVTHPDDFFGPMRNNSIFGSWLDETSKILSQPAWKILLYQLQLGFQAYIRTPIKYFYLPGTPILRSVSAGLFIVGLVFLLREYRKPQSWVLILWLVLIALMGAFSTSTPAAQRYIASAPACAIVIGLGIAKIPELFKKVSSTLSKVFTFLIFLSVWLIGAEDATFYFWDFTPKSYINWKPNVVKQYLAINLLDIPGTWELVYSGNDQENLLSNPVMRYLNPHLKKDDFLILDRLVSPPYSSDKHLVFVFFPNEAESLQFTQTLYQEGNLIDERGVYGKTLYWIYDYDP